MIAADNFVIASFLNLFPAVCCRQTFDTEPAVHCRPPPAGPVVLQVQHPSVAFNAPVVSAAGSAQRSRTPPSKWGAPKVVQVTDDNTSSYKRCDHGDESRRMLAMACCGIACQERCSCVH